MLPVMNDAASLARSTTPGAISSGAAQRFIVPESKSVEIPADLWSVNNLTGHGSDVHNRTAARAPASKSARTNARP